LKLNIYGYPLKRHCKSEITEKIIIIIDFMEDRIISFSVFSAKAFYIIEGNGKFKNGEIKIMKGRQKQTAR
jgi:hypothetical protein